jgi:16S rRNA (cytidine1402-2'-O)-methyltransferase
VSGRLSVVATPIGNLGDLSPRAAEALRTADVIAAEDTRRARKLLSHLGVATPQMVSSHAHNEGERSADIVGWVARGRHVVLVTDAGTPGVSDPGATVVSAVAAAGLTVEVVPGPSAALAALSASGLASERFCVEGFLPRKGSARRQRLRELAGEVRAAVVFEAPGRVGATLADLAEVCGPDRPAAVCRELTKLHEEVDRGPLGDLAARWAEARKGEHVIVLGGAAAPVAEEADPDDLAAAMARYRASGLTRRDAAAATAEELGVPRRTAYEAGGA